MILRQQAGCIARHGVVLCAFQDSLRVNGMETNQLHNLLEDLRNRGTALRGYL
jgi:hypothetical protein